MSSYISLGLVSTLESLEWLPPQILRAVQILACDAYGSMLWRLDSAAATSFFNAHTSCIKRVYRLPLNTFSYLVEGHLGERTLPLSRGWSEPKPKLWAKTKIGSCSIRIQEIPAYRPQLSGRKQEEYILPVHLFKKWKVKVKAKEYSSCFLP